MIFSPVKMYTYIHIFIHFQYLQGIDIVLYLVYFLYNI
uniref:Uncharacterized protein n=1 Tax=Anguilla anguilla TaxID=7936 RepID=A0A0E9PWT8_ANGAN